MKEHAEPYKALQHSSEGYKRREAHKTGKEGKDQIVKGILNQVKAPQIKFALLCE